MRVGVATDHGGFNLKDELVRRLRADCANKVAGIRAALIHDHFSAKEGVEDDHLNILCMGGRTVGPAVAWDLVQAFLSAEFSQADRHLRRLDKVARREAASIGSADGMC